MQTPNKLNLDFSVEVQTFADELPHPDLGIVPPTLDIAPDEPTTLAFNPVTAEFQDQQQDE